MTNPERLQLKIEKNKPTVLFFGYLAWYKGADLMIELAQANKKMNFIIAGGPSFTQKHKAHYKKYLEKFNNLPKNLKITGFVKEKQIPLYFSASNLVILPYRSMISSSGPLSLAYSFEKPILLSNKLKPYLKSDDFKKNFKNVDLDESKLFNDFEKNKKINLNKKYISQLVQFSKMMKATRDHKKISNQYLNTLQ